MTEPTGANLIAGAERASGSVTFRSVDPRTGREDETSFHDATSTEVAEAALGAAPRLEGELHHPRAPR